MDEKNPVFIYAICLDENEGLPYNRLLYEDDNILLLVTHKHKNTILSIGHAYLPVIAVYNARC